MPDQQLPIPAKNMTDEEATEFDWWFLDILRHELFVGQKIEPSRKDVLEKRKALTKIKTPTYET